jgi:hypothetical protein
MFEADNTPKQLLPSTDTTQQCRFMLADIQEERIEPSTMQQTFYSASLFIECEI